MSDSRLEKMIIHPVFIVGAPRSGTSWVQRLLLSEPSFCGGQETHFFNVFGLVIRSYQEHLKLGRNVGLPSYWEEHALLSEIRSLWERTVAPLIRRHPDARLLIEKTPDHALVLPEILQLFPRARVIHVVRDSRAVAASLLAASQGWGAAWAPRSARSAAKLWSRYVATAAAVGQQLPAEQYFMVRYEDLMRDGIEEIRRLFAFLGQEKSTQSLRETLDAHSFSRQRISESPIPVVRGDGGEPKGFFRSGTTDGWRLDLNWLQKRIVWFYTSSQMHKMGYRWDGRASVAISSASSFPPPLDAVPEFPLFPA